MVGGYARLSRDEDKKNYVSIETQKQIIKDYAEKNNLGNVIFFIDDNVTGYTFERPGFTQMMDNLGVIDTIIAKDLSRIGRHNARTLMFLEDMEKKGIRVILVDEGSGYDSEEDEDDMLGIKTWYNERYVKDISKKIRSSIKVKQSQGEHLVRIAYGYRRDTNNKHLMVVDPLQAEVVRKIFDLYINGHGFRNIAGILNEEGVPTPSEDILREKTDFKGKVSKLWAPVNILRIINNQVYKGSLVLGSRTRKGIHGKDIKKDPYVFENKHEAIISDEMFELAQSVLASREKAYRGSRVNDPKPFTGFLYCKDCGSKLILKEKRQIFYYMCGAYKNKGLKACTAHTIREDVLIGAFKIHLGFIKEELKGFIGNLKLKHNENDYEHQEKLLVDELDELNKEMTAIIKLKIKDAVKGKIIQDTYREIEEDAQKRIKNANLRLKEVRKIINNEYENQANTVLQVFDKIIDKFERKYVEILVDKIIIDEKGNAEFKMKSDIEEIINGSLSIHTQVGVK